MQDDPNAEGLFSEEDWDKKKPTKRENPIDDDQSQDGSVQDDSSSQQELSDDPGEQNQDQDEQLPKRKGTKMRGKLKKKKRGGINDYVDFEASESDRDDDDQEDLDDAEIRTEEAKKKTQDYYKKPRRNEHYAAQYYGKNDDQINKMMQMKLYNQYMAESNCPSVKDPKVFQIPVVKGKEDSLTLAILNKAFHLKDKKQEALTICSVMSMKRKFPCCIFVEAMTQQDVKKSLEGFLDIMLRQMQEIKEDQYPHLFKEREAAPTSLKENDYIRIKGGKYDGDLGRIQRLRKNGLQVILQPRVDVAKFGAKIKQITERDPSDKDKLCAQAIKRYFGTKDTVEHKFRPNKAPLTADQFCFVTSFRKVKLTQQGMILLSFPLAEVTKQIAPVTLKQFQSFKKDEALIEFARKQLKHLSSTISLAKGDEVEVVHGDFKGTIGIVRSVNDDIVMIDAKNKPNIKQFEQQIQKLAKRFRQKQTVTVITGKYQGKTGIILAIQKQQATILTDNNNEIVVQTNNLKLSDGTSRSTQASQEYRKNDLVLTLGLGSAGLVLSCIKDTLTILDLNNSVRVISIMDVDKKLDTRNNRTINTFKEEIKQGAVIRIRDGTYSGKRGEVRHVYKNSLFVTSNDISSPCGACVIRDTNCTVVAQSSSFRKPKPTFGSSQLGQGSTSNPKTNQSQNSPSDDKAQSANNRQGQALTVGKVITIKSGEHKGYQGQIVNCYKDDVVEVKLTAKLGKRVMVKKCDITAQKKSLEMGKTPRVSGSSYVPQSPAPMGMGESRYQRSHQYDR